MHDSIVFNTLEELVTFSNHVELLFRIARAQQCGDYTPSHFTNSVNALAFRVILTPSLDREKNWYNNRTMAIPDKPDYQALNPLYTWHTKRGQIRP